MPQIEFANQIVQCAAGENLRRVLIDAQLPLYNGLATAIHCRGMGTCGTCSVEIDGKVSPMTAVEKWRLNFPRIGEKTTCDWPVSVRYWGI